MHMIKRASIQTKIIMIPLVTSVFLIVTLGFHITALQNEKKILQDVEKKSLKKIGILSDLFARLSRNHAQISTILSSASYQLDEEAVYEQGIQVIYKISAIERQIREIHDDEGHKSRKYEDKHLHIIIDLLEKYKKIF